MNEREEILKAITIIQREEKCNVRDALVIYVLADRKRICEPLVKALESLIDDEECSSDHHGYCQTHFSGSSPCLMAEARKTLAGLSEDTK